MRALNESYRLLLRAAAADAARDARAPLRDSVVPERGRLSRDEIDRIVRSIGTASPVDVLVDTLPYGRRTERLWQWITRRAPGSQWEITDSAAAGLAFLGGCLLLLLFQWRGGRDVLNSRAWYFVYAAPFVVAVLRRLRG